MGVRSLLLATSLFGLTACTLLVSTSGLSDPDGTPASDGGVADSGPALGDAGSDAPRDGGDGSAADAGADAAPACPGRIATTGWSTFDKEPGASVAIAGDRLTATVTMSTLGESKSSVATYFRGDLAPKTLRVAYDLELRPSATIYFEPGCSVFVIGPEGTLTRHVPGVSGGELLEYVNVYKSGPDDDRQRKVSTLPAATSVHHFDVTFSIAGKNVVVDTVVDGSAMRFDAITLDVIPTGFFVNCGIPFSTQTANQTGSVSVDVSGMSLVACP